MTGMAETPDSRLDAMERALGIAPLEGREDADGAAKAEQAWVEQRLAVLAEVLEPVPPGAGLFSRIVAAAGIDLPMAGFHVLRRDEGVWKPVAPGIETKTLWRNTPTGRRVFLLRMHPGAVMPEHDHASDEECMVLEGDMQVNGVAFGPGDFQVGYAGSHHPHVTTRGGCVCMISVAA
jgi:anti-sigma factor ChrR (cupin superfamily)